jgi:Mn2+/Fe2+ NRAMP family transporter
VSGITDIETAAQAATALRPLAGDFAFILFALGILGVGLIGVPVLAGSAAYALAEWPLRFDNQISIRCFMPGSMT